ncbi:hypothetical protein ACHWQZ_G008563 [Mnemiopsis leidyi]
MFEEERVEDQADDGVFHEQTQLDTALQYCLPIVCTLTLPITCVNLWVLLQKELRRRPSHFLYTNMLILDLIIIVGGICIEISIRNHGNVSKVADGIFDVIYQIAFYSGIVMLLGLGVCRVMSMKTTATFYVQNGIKTAGIFVLIAWTLGITLSVSRKTVLKDNTVMLVSNVSLYIILSVSTMAINLYILVKIIQARGHLDQRIFRQASKAALMLFLNSAIWNTLYVVRCVSFLVILIESGKTYYDCSEYPWIMRILFCGFVRDKEVRHVVEVTFLAQSLGNNLILITQPESKVILTYVWGRIREAFSNLNMSEGYDQFYD